MIAKLPDELLRALEQAGDEPLPVENPHNHKRYLIVVDEREARRNDALPSVVGGEWSEDKNRRRFHLISKETAGSLTPDEAVELNRLQNEVDEYLNQVAPLPIAQTEALLEQLRQSLHQPL